MEKVLVDINILEGLVESIEVEIGDSIHLQIKDYCNVPFCCAWYHTYGHVVETCTKPFD